MLLYRMDASYMLIVTLTICGVLPSVLTAGLDADSGDGGHASVPCGGGRRHLLRDSLPPEQGDGGLLQGRAYCTEA